MKKLVHALLFSVSLLAGTSTITFAADPITPTTNTAPVTTPTVEKTLSPSTVTPTIPVAATIPVTEAVAPAVFSPEQVIAIQNIIKTYLVANPQVLVEASQALQMQQEKQMQNSAMSAIKENKTTLFNDAKTPAVGSKDAPVTVVEFFDYQCGHCHQVAPIIEKLISNDKNVRFMFKELPIFGGVSQFAAKAALAAVKQNKYYKFHTLLLSTNGPLTKEKVMELAKKAELNITELKKDMDAPEIDAQLKSNFQLAQSLKIMGTPTFVITNKAQDKFRFIPGAASMSDLQAQIQLVQ